MKQHNRKNCGFTLTELLIVVAIVGVLASIGVPTFRKMIKKAMQVEAKVNLAAMVRGARAYQAEHNAYPIAPTTGSNFDSSERYGLLADKTYNCSPNAFREFNLEIDCPRLRYGYAQLSWGLPTYFAGSGCSASEDFWTFPVDGTLAHAIDGDVGCENSSYPLTH